MWWWQYCLVNFISISMHRIHIIFLIRRIEKYIYCYDSVWNGEEPCISSMLGYFRNGLGFCMKAGGKKLSYFYCFCLYFAYGVYSWAHKSTGEISMGISTDSASQHMGDTTTKGSQAREAQYFCLSTGALWMKFHPKCNCSCSTTKWDSKCNLHMTSWCF